MKASALVAAYLRTLWLARRLRTRADVERHQAKGLRAAIDHAGRRLPHYRGCVGARLDELPVVDKAAHLAGFAAFNTERLDADRARAIIDGRDALPGFEVGGSTGTSGVRGLYVISEDERFRWLGTIVAKVLPGAVLRRHRVAVVLPGASALYRSAGESRILRLAQCDARQGPASFGPEVAAFRPSVVVAAPKSLRALAGGPVRPERLVSAGEVLGPGDRRCIAEAFASPLRQVYMATEGLLGSGCAAGRLHLAEDVAAFEFEAIAGSDGLVTPVVSDFTRRTQAMLRYRLGDALRLVEGPCPCGSPLRCVEVVGRAEDLIRLPGRDGSSVALSPDVLERAIVDALGCHADFRLGLAENGRDLRLLADASAGAAAIEAARLAVEPLCRERGLAARVEAVPARLAAPFDRKLRRIAPVAPDRL